MGLTMAADKEAILAVHSRAITGHDVETILDQAACSVRCVRDGNLVGEGREALRRTLEAEYVGRDGLVARIVDLDGEAVLVEFDGREGSREPRAVLHVDSANDRITEWRVDHDQDLVARLARSAALPR
ncbi:MAG: hypothetical protein ACYDBQ_04560 [Thermoplasmatota archaeon]